MRIRKIFHFRTILSGRPFFALELFYSRFTYRIHSQAFTPVPQPICLFLRIDRPAAGVFFVQHTQNVSNPPAGAGAEINFFQYCTPGIIRNRLIKFFCQNRTLLFDVSGAIQAHLNESAHFLYSIQPQSRPNLPDQAGEQPRSCPIRPAMPLYYSKGKPYHPVNPLPPQVIPCT